MGNISNAIEKLGHGYAYDLIISSRAEYVDSTGMPFTDQDADSVFRALVLDEGWDIEDATGVYDELMAVVNSEPAPEGKVIRTYDAPAPTMGTAEERATRADGELEKAYPFFGGRHK